MARPYRCRVCGLPKAGHTCLGKRKLDDDDEEGAERAGAASSSHSLSSDKTFESIIQTHVDAMKSELYAKYFSGPPPKPSAEEAYNALMFNIQVKYDNAIDHHKDQYDKEKARLQAEYTNAMQTYQQQQQTSQATVRKVEFFDGVWKEITDSIAETTLFALHDDTGTLMTTTYRTNGHAYTATKDLSNGNISQVNDKYATSRDIRIVQKPTALATSAAPVCKDPPPWQIEVYFNKWTLDIKDSFIDELLYNYNHECVGTTILTSASIADLGTMFDSMGNKMVFSKERSQLWVNSVNFTAFMRTARHRQETQMRLVCHGSGFYNKLREDPMVFDPAFYNQGGRLGPGIYVAMSPHIAADYKKHRSFKNGSDNPPYPDGTMMIGLLRQAASKHPSNVYQDYAMGSLYDYTVGHDAYKVTNPNYLCWLGLCVP